MNALHIITPVKDSIETTMDTIRAVCQSQLNVPHTYTVYDDFSTPENAQRLDEAAREYGIEVVHLSQLTDHPSPNYLLVLQTARKKALAADAALAIVESDVVVRPDTLQQLYDGITSYLKCGIAAAVTVDELGVINYPYVFARKYEGEVRAERHHCSFCCSVLSPALLTACDFDQLDSSKNWFDVTISHDALKAGLRNYVFTTVPVWHRPHGSRPWKQLKYTNPLKYYWLKFTKGLDKI